MSNLSIHEANYAAMALLGVPYLVTSPVLDDRYAVTQGLMWSVRCQFT